jgi:hypothetical protein
LRHDHLPGREADLPPAPAEDTEVDPCGVGASFAAEVLRQRLVVVAQEPPDHLLFFTRNDTPLTTNNIRRRLRAMLAEAGITGVTPHAFRRTVATVLDRASGPDLAAEMLGHTSSKITKQHYIEPDETVDPITAEILEALAPRPAEYTSALADPAQSFELCAEGREFGPGGR